MQAQVRKWENDKDLDVSSYVYTYNAVWTGYGRKETKGFSDEMHLKRQTANFHKLQIVYGR